MEVGEALQTSNENFLVSQVFNKDNDAADLIFSQLPLAEVFELRTLCKSVKKTIDESQPLWRRICQIYFSKAPGVLAAQQECSLWRAEFFRLDAEFRRPIRELGTRISDSSGQAQDYYSEIRSLAQRATEKGLEGVLHSCARLLTTFDPFFRIAWPLLELSRTSPDALLNVALEHDRPHIVWEIIRLRNPTGGAARMRSDACQAWVNHAANRKAIAVLKRAEIFPTADEICAAIAANTFDPEQLAWMLDLGICRNAKHGECGLSLASLLVKLEKLDYLKCLVTHGWSIADPNLEHSSTRWQGGSTPLHVAACFGVDEKVIRFLVETDRGLLDAQDSIKQTPLDVAAFSNQGQAIRILADLGADLSLRSTSLFAPLHVAVMSEYEDAVKALLESGADRNIRTQDGFTPLHLATQRLYTRIIDLLLRFGANPNLAESHSYTPLHFACIGLTTNHLAVASLLLSEGANPNLMSSSGLTPFHVAIRSGNRVLVQRLLTSGRVDLTISTLDGKTPRRLAEEIGSQAVRQLLDEFSPRASNN